MDNKVKDSFVRYFGSNFRGVTKVGFCDYSPSMAAPPREFIERASRMFSAATGINLIKGKETNTVKFILIFPETPSADDLIKIGILHPHGYENFLSGRWGIKTINPKSNRFTFLLYVETYA